MTPDAALSGLLALAWAWLAAGTVVLRSRRLPPRSSVRSVADRRVVTVLRRLGRRVRRFAGRHADDEAAELRWGAGAVGLPLVVLMVGPVPAVALVGALAVAGWWRGRREAADHRRQIDEAVPDLAVRFAVALRSGLTVPVALGVVADQTPGPAGDTLARAHRQLRLGRDLGTVLDGLRHELGTGARGLVQALGSAARLGVSVDAALATLAAEARRQRRRHAEGRVRRLPTLLLLPGTFGVLPAFVLLVVVPIAATALDGLPA